MQPAKVFVLDLDQTCKRGSTLAAGLLHSGMASVPVSHGVMALSDCLSTGFSIPLSLSSPLPDVIFIVLPPASGKDLEALFKRLKNQAPAVPLIAVAGPYEQEQITSLIGWGASDILSPPFKDHDIASCMERWGRPRDDQDRMILSLKEKIGLKQLIGESPSFLSEIKKIPLMARCDAGVLISGETGTGKELCARAVHYLSPRAGHPFIPVNCGAIPADLVENELFGHVQGAFTHANNSKTGLIAEADKGSLFLDEVDCLTPAAQVKLLRFLQEKEYRQLGSTRITSVDVRVIAATGLNIVEAVRTGLIRQDLYYRLDVIPLTLPPLRERMDDIPILSMHFLDKYNQALGKHIGSFHPHAMQKLLLHNWPGNVRELEYVIERAVLFCENLTVMPADIIFPRFSMDCPVSQETFKDAKSKIINNFERTYILGLLRVYQGNISKASKAAKKNRRAFWQLMRKHRINAQAFRAGQ